VGVKVNPFTSLWQKKGVGGPIQNRGGGKECLGETRSGRRKPLSGGEFSRSKRVKTGGPNDLAKKVKTRVKL